MGCSADVDGLSVGRWGAIVKSRDHEQRSRGSRMPMAGGSRLAGAGHGAGDPVAVVVVEIHEAGADHWWTSHRVDLVLDHRRPGPSVYEAEMVAGHHLLQGTDHACECGGDALPSLILR